MSRHTLQDPDGRYEIVVGYDRPLQTYFGQVFDPVTDEDDEKTIFVCGWLIGEIRTLDELQERMAPYINNIPQAVRKQMEQEWNEGNGNMPPLVRQLQRDGLIR